MKTYQLVGLGLLAVLEVLGRLIVLLLIAADLEDVELEGELVDGQIVLAGVHLQRAGEETLREEDSRQPVRGRRSVCDPTLLKTNTS